MYNNEIQPLPENPKSMRLHVTYFPANTVRSQPERNQKIYARYKKKESKVSIAKDFDLSLTVLNQIIFHCEKLDRAEKLCRENDYTLVILTKKLNFLRIRFLEQLSGVDLEPLLKSKVIGIKVFNDLTDACEKHGVKAIYQKKPEKKCPHCGKKI